MGRCFHSRGHPRPLAGRNADGSWATAAAKQQRSPVHSRGHPPRFCELIASGVAEAIQRWASPDNDPLGPQAGA
eukprot:11164859-Lingulodinium_polyedra.AAC.1